MKKNLIISFILLMQCMNQPQKTFMLQPGTTQKTQSSSEVEKELRDNKPLSGDEKNKELPTEARGTSSQTTSLEKNEISEKEKKYLSTILEAVKNKSKLIFLHGMPGSGKNVTAEKVQKYLAEKEIVSEIKDPDEIAAKIIEDKESQPYIKAFQQAIQESKELLERNKGKVILMPFTILDGGWRQKLDKVDPNWYSILVHVSQEISKERFLNRLNKNSEVDRKGLEGQKGEKYLQQLENDWEEMYTSEKVENGCCVEQGSEGICKLYAKQQYNLVWHND